jgi:hypothetical protein
MIVFVQKIRAKVRESEKAHKASTVTQHVGHLTYLGLVSIEGHGLYALAALFLFISVAVSLFFKLGVAE